MPCKSCKTWKFLYFCICKFFLVVVWMPCTSGKTGQAIKDSDGGWEKINLRNFASGKSGKREFSGEKMVLKEIVTSLQELIWRRCLCEYKWPSVHCEHKRELHLANPHSEHCATVHCGSQLHLASPLRKRSSADPHTNWWCGWKWQRSLVSPKFFTPAAYFPEFDQLWLLAGESREGRWSVTYEVGQLLR